jgi:hypothetical protein
LGFVLFCDSCISLAFVESLELTALGTVTRLQPLVTLLAVRVVKARYAVGIRCSGVFDWGAVVVQETP